MVAVARMVAAARGCQIGEEVGYHIGHSKVLSSRFNCYFPYKTSFLLSLILLLELFCIYLSIVLPQM